MEIIAYDNAKLNNTAVALGKFEGVHKGHMLLINKISELASTKDIKSVVFTINMSGENAINLDSERYEIFESLGVDYVCECPFDEKISSLTPEDFIKKILVERLGASYIVVGEDFCFGHKRRGNVNTLTEYSKEYNYEVVVFEKLKVDDRIVSSSSIREFLDTGDVKKVADFMGRPYSISGIVTEGKKLGRTIGFPTVNIKPDIKKRLPLAGAYETRIIISGDSKIYKGITNVGNNPTVNPDVCAGSNVNALVETHLIDFDGDLYGKEIQVDFIRFIRPEMKFDNVEKLKKQLIIDKESVV